MEQKKYKLLLLKAYFDKGLGLTNYIKYMIAFFGIASLNAKVTLILGIVYGVLCFIVGWVWFRFRLVEVEKEIENKYNLFVTEMREMSGSYSVNRKP